MKTIIGKNAEKLALKELNSKYSLFKVVFIINTDKQFYSGFLENAKNIVKNVVEVKLPNITTANEISTQLINKALTDDVGLVVIIGSEDLINLVLSLNIKYNIMIYLTKLQFFVQINRLSIWW